MTSLARFESVVDDLRAGRSGSLVVGTFASAGEHWLPGVTSDVLAEFPDTQWSIVLTDPPATRREPDLDLVTEDPGEEPRSRPGFGRIVLMTEPYVVLLPADHPLAGQAEVEAGDLAGERWIRDDVAESTCSRITGNAWRAAGFTPRAIVQAADHHGAARFVAAGLGVCVMPALPAANPPDGVAVRPLVNPKPCRRIAVHVRDAIGEHPAAVRFVERLQQVAAGSGLSEH